MSKPTTKSRQDLRSRFVRDAIPSEADFADLIAASLNQADDGVRKLPDQPLGLVRQKPDQPMLRFFADPADDTAVWQLQLGSDDKPSFGLARADGKPKLVVDVATGYVGIGAAPPISPLTITGNVPEGETRPSRLKSQGAVAITSICPQLDFIDIDHKDWSICVDAGRMHFIREPWEAADLVLDGAGRVGVGTANPGNKLTVQADNNSYRDPESGLSTGGQLALKGNAPQIDFIDTDHGDWAIQVNEGCMYFVREPWDYQDFVLDGKGNIGIGSSTPQAKLNIVERDGTPASALKGTFLIDHGDPGGASSIVFTSKVNRGTNFGYIEYRDKNPSINDQKASLLTIGVQNNANDHIALMPSGNVGIGTTTPTCKLDLTGSLRVSGSITPSPGNNKGNGLVFANADSSGSEDAAWIRYYAYSGEACVLEIGIGKDADDYLYLRSTGGVKIDVLRLGEKWRFSGIGDYLGNDEWLRMTNINNTGYSGGFAAAKFWATQGQYTQSDLRSKENIKELDSALENLLGLHGISFTRKSSIAESGGIARRQLGLIAQDVAKVFPELVNEGPDNFLGVDYIGLIPVLVESLKSLQKQIHRLEQQAKSLP